MTVKSIDCSQIISIKLHLVFEDNSIKDREIYVGDLVDIDYNNSGTKAQINGKIIKIICNSNNANYWTLIVENLEDSSLSRISPMDILDCEIIKKYETVAVIETPIGPNKINYLRIVNGKLQYCQDGYNWITINTGGGSSDSEFIVESPETPSSELNYRLWIDNNNPESMILKFFDGTKWVSVSEYNVVEGVDGKSAYEIAVEHGFIGTEEEWLLSLKGNDGAPGKDGAVGEKGEKGDSGNDGKSVYEIAVEYGFVGTEEEWLLSLKGNDGAPGKDGADGEKGDPGQQGEPGKDGTDGINGSDGKSVYQIAVEQGFIGTEEEWLLSLKGDPGVDGKDGSNGTDGVDGKSAYQIALDNGFVGTEQEWLESLKGDKGDPGNDGIGVDGESAYDIAVNNGFVGTEQEWLESLKGESGADGKDGSNGTDGLDGKSAYQIALDNGFVGTEEEWLESLKGDPGNDGTPGKDGSNGIDGESAYDIAVNNGFVGTEEEWLESLKGEPGVDGADGKEGRSVKSVTTDEANNVIATYSDGTSEVLGKLDINVQADFLTEVGFGDLRYYNGKFQYYNSSTSTWVDASATSENIYILNISPQEMKFVDGVYDIDLGYNKLKWEESNDTIVENQSLCTVEKIVIRRKLNSLPVNENDGELVLELNRSDFGTYKNQWYIDRSFIPNIGEKWYYRFFPVSTTGFISTNIESNSLEIFAKDYHLYGFKIDQNESDPASMITYIEGCDNEMYRSAYMDYTADTFNYGDWADAWFIKNLKPCMLKYDGTVDYELNKDDYTKKLDGTDSDISNESYEGNAMVGIPKVYWKIVDNGDDTINVYFSDRKLDDDFVCWSHIDNNGNEIDYCYMAVYDGSNVSNRLRSISDKAPMANQTATTEIAYAQANNTDSDVIWNTGLTNDWVLINLLLLLIGKSTDTQTVFGTGNNNSYISAVYTGIKNTGTLNDKGLFYGKNDNTSCIKVFGIENFYGNIWKRIAGWINDNGIQKIKLTYGQSDGSTVDGYNETGSGYIVIDSSTPGGTSGGYTSKMIASNNCLIPVDASGSATTYYCDGLFFKNSQVDYAIVGGYSYFGNHVGALCLYLSDPASSMYFGFGSTISCKPLANK